MNKLRIVFGVQLVLFIAWGGYLLSSKNSASPEFYLETRPVDPRDLLSGKFVALNYDISSPQAGTCPTVSSTALSFFVKLEDRGRTVNTENGPVHVYEATDCAKTAPFGAAVWAHATPRPGFFGRNSAIYGIESFFINENNPLKDARSGSVIAKVKLGRNNQLVLLDLVKKIQP